jgi:hypothetical protein
MALSEMLLPEFDHEMANTRKMFEHIPARLSTPPKILETQSPCRSRSRPPRLDQPHNELGGSGRESRRLHTL